MILFGIKGHSHLHFCETTDQKPEGSIEMLSRPPNDGKRYLAREDGTWEEDQSYTKQSERAEELKIDTAIETLANATPVQIKNHINDNVGDLPTAREYLAKAFILISYLLNKE